MRERGEGGQATAELAASIPFLVLMIMLLVQVGTVMLDQLAVAQAAREGARAAAVDSSPGSAAAAARSATRLRGDRLSVDVGRRPDGAGMVEVTVSYESRVVMPFTGTVLMRPRLGSSAAMRVETG